ENLAWKLAAVDGGAPEALLDTYDAERRPAALENLAATDATMRFMAPHGWLRQAWRNLVLRMAPRSGWFRSRVNSGRLAEPAVYPAAYAATGPLDPSLPRHGSVAPDVPLAGGGRLRDRFGRGYVVLLPHVLDTPAGVATVLIGPDSPYGPDRAWVVRPDGYLAGSAPVDEIAIVLPDLLEPR
ncbi:MAG: FAD-dependent monooxygenase, partial [Candidatus Limnocylindria bacterium]